MSDYEYDYDGDNAYGDQDAYGDEQNEADIEATIEVDCFDAEELIRKGQLQDGLEAFKAIYETAQENNLRNWKIKAASQILQIQIQMNNPEQVKKILGTIGEINEKDKISESTVKSIIIILQGISSKLYQHISTQIQNFINSLQPALQIKSYTMMLEKDIEEKNVEEGKKIFAKIKSIMRNNSSQINVGSEVQIFSLELRLDKLQGLTDLQKVRKMKLKLPSLEDQTSISDTHLSQIKEKIAQLMYDEQNFQQSAKYLCACFLENAQFGKNSQNLKTMLKTNVIILLLNDNKEIIEDRAYNPLKHDYTSTFKMEADVQALFGLIQAFNNLNLPSFLEILKVVDLSGTANTGFAGIQEKVILQLKKEKTHFILSAYKKIKFDYIHRRINESDQIIIEILFALIAENKINGIIHIQERYFQVLPPIQRYYEMQIQNLRDLQERM